MDKLKKLEDDFEVTNAKMDELKENLRNLQTKIDRGEKLVQGLSGEKTRWEA